VNQAQRRAIAYVDGFNFYHGAMKGQPALKWLDYQALSELLLDRCRVLHVNYYTARVNDRPNDPGQSQRQDVYLRALATRPKIEIVYGVFRTNRKVVPVAGTKGQQLVRADVTEEKGSDVNLATDLTWDASHGLMDVALVLSNDFDLQRPIARAIDAGVEVVVVNPHRSAGQKPSVRGSTTRNLRLWHLRQAQLPDPVTDAAGRSISRPPTWA